MKKNNFWFTFVEILVVVAILTLVSWVSISSFNRSFERQSLIDEINIFSNLIKDYDKDIWNDITDYNIYISTWSFYYYTLNNLYKPVIQSISFNSFTWTIKTNDLIKRNMNLTIYFDNKKLYTVSLSSTWNYFYNVKNKWKYEFFSSISGELLNTIYVDYFTKTDIKKNIELTEIKDQSWNIYTGVIIKNDLSKNKLFTTFTWQIINSDLDLKFEWFWTTTTLKLTK
jgi:hypothetical protein